MNPMPAAPDYLHSEEGGYYVRRQDTLEASFEPVGDHEDFTIREVWLRAVPPPPMEERWDPEPLRARGPDGKYQRVWWWEECPAETADAVPYYRAEWNLQVPVERR